MKNYDSKYALIKNNIKESVKILTNNCSCLISITHFQKLKKVFFLSLVLSLINTNFTYAITVNTNTTHNVTGWILTGASGSNNTINATYTLSNLGTRTYSRNFSGGGTLAVTGTTNLTLAGTNSITGTLNLNGGDITITGTTAALTAIEIRNANSTLTLNRHDIFGNHQANSPTVTFTAGGTLANGSNRFNHIGAVTLVNGATITTNGNHSSGGTAIAGMNLDGDITLGMNATANFNATNNGTYGLGTGSDTPANRNFTIGSNSTLNVNAPLVNGQGGLLGWPTNKPAASITKSGAGTLVLAGANTYTGNTTISAGTLEITGTLGASASYAGTISNSGTLTFNSSSNQTLTGSVTGSGIWNKSGSGRLTITGSNPFNGTININAGTFRITSTAGTSSQTVNVLSGATLDLDDKNFQSNTRVITIEGTGVGNVGALYLSEGGSDNTAFNNSTIQLNADASIGVASGDTLRLYDGDSDTVITSQGSENNSLTITGSGKVEVEDKINIGTGNITVGSNATLEIEGSQNTITAGTVTVNGTLIADTHDIFGTSNASSRPSMVLNGTFTNESGHISILGNTTLNGGTINISDGHSYSGAEIALGLDGTVTVGGSSASTINSTSGDGTISLTHNNAAGSRDVTFNVADATSDSSVDLTINANIQDGVGSTYPTTVASGIIKTGAGELQLQGANTYTGSTVINAGTLRIKGTSSETASLANTDITINSGGKFILGAYSSINSGADIDINSGGEMRVKQSLSNAITISGNGTGDLSNSGALINTGGSNTYSSTITVDGGATVSATSGTMTFSPSSGNAFSGTGNLTFLAANDITVNNSVVGVADIIKSGNQKLDLYGTNTYTGNTIVSGGTFNINGTVPTTTELVFQSPSSTPNVYFKNDSNITIGGIDGDVAGDGFTPEVFFDSVGTRDRDYTLNVATGRTLSTNANVAGPGYGDGQLFKTGAGSQTILGNITGFGSTSAKGLTVQNGTLTLGSSNQIVGGVAITGGTLVVPADASFGVDPGSFDDDNIQIGNGTLQFSNSGTITLDTDRGIDITHDSAIINVSNSSGRVNYNGDIKGDNNLTKTGSGIFALGAANTHDLTGDVTINGGQFRFLSGTSNAYNFDVTVGNTGVASINSNSFASGKSVTVQSGGSLNLYPGTGGGRTYGVDINLAGSGNNNLNGGTAATLTTSSGSNATLTGTVTLNSNASVLMRPNGSSVSGKIFFGSADGNTTTAVALGSNTFTLKAEGSNTREYDFRDQVTGTGTLDIDRYATANFISGEGSFTDTVNLDVQGTLNMSSSDTIASLTGTSTGSIDLRNTTLTINQSSNTTYAGAITDSTGTSSIVKSGTGTLTLSGTNSYSGNTTIRAGNLSISAENNLGSTPGAADADNIIFNGGGLTITSGVTFSANRGVTMTGAGTINTASSTTSTLQGIITGSGTLTKAGDGDLILSGTNTHSGTLAITDGSVVLSGSLNDTQAVTVSSGATFDTSGDETIGSIAGAGTLDIEHKSQLTVGGDNSSTIFSGVIQSTGSGTGGITKQGTGTLTLSGNNTFSGGVTVVAGTIAVTANNALGDTTNTTIVQSGATIDFQNVNYSTTETLRNSGNIATSTGTSSFAGGVQLLADSGLDVDGTQLTLSGVVSGSSALNKTGNGIAILSGTNTYSGNTSITEGTLRVTGSLNNSTNVTVSSGATYDVDATDQVGSIAGAGTIDIASSVTLSAGNSGNTSVSGVVSGSGNLRKLGSGTLTLSGTNTYSGNTTISNGRLTVSGTLNDNTIVSVASGAVYDVDETDEIGSVFGNGNIEIASSKTLTTGDADGSSTTRTIGGIISGAGGFTKKGEGRLNLTGDSTYTGTTSITNGQLRLQSGSSIDSTTINVSGDGRLYLESEDALLSTANITLNGAASRLYVAEDNTVNTVSGAGGIHIQSDNILTVTDISSHTGKVKGQGDIVIAASHTLGAFIDTTDSSNDNINTRISGASTTVTMATSNFLPDDEDLTVENSGTLNLNSNTDTVANVNLTSGTISGGTINASNQHTLSSGTIASSATLGGAGALSKTSSGTTTFAGTGSYSGATTISAGTLTVTGALSNTTGVTLSGGTMNLNSTSAVNSSADMTVSSGSLNVNENITVADFASSSGTTTTIASGRMLTVNPGTANNDIYGLAGSGGFKKMGSVRSILRGSHNYTGETRVTEGILQLASGGSINSSTELIIESGAEFDLDESVTAASLADAGNVDVASSKVLTINGSGTKTFSGRLRGSGGFTYSGSGTMTFRGNNDISGPISFNSGTIYAGTADDSSTTIFSNNITLAGATLGGGGKIGGNVTSTGGSLAPGNSIGTLTIDGNLELDSSSTTTIEFNTTSADKVVVDGNITLAGSLVLEPASGTYSDITFTIFDGSDGSGNTLSGTFASTTTNNSSNLGDATTSISYDTVNRKVFLEIEDNAVAVSNTVASLTTNSEFKDVAAIFDAATAGKILEVANVLKSSNTNSVNTELDKLEGTIFATAYNQPVLNHGHFNRALNSVTSSNVNTSLVSSFANNTDELTFSSLQQAGLFKDKKKFNEYYDYSDTNILGFIKNNKNKSIFNNFKSDDSSTFIRTYGTTAKRDNIGSSYTGYESETTGILFGQQFKNEENKFTGYSYGFTGTDTDYNNNYGESKTYSLHASLFRQYDEDKYGLNLISGMYVSKTESERNVSVFGTSVNDKYVSDYWDIGFNQEAQYIKKIDIAGLSLAPSAKINSTYVIKSDTEETGGELALTIDNENIFVLKPEIGLSIAKDFSEKNNLNNEFSVAMFASQDHFLEGTTSNARFTSGSSFNVDLPRDQETYYSVGLGYNFLNKETDTSFMANAFMMQNEHSDMDSNIFSLTFRKLFGEFSEGKIPPVIAKKSDEEDITEIFLPETQDERTIKDGEKSLDEFEKNIEIVLKDNPTQSEVGQVYKSMSDSLIVKKKLTVNDVYKNLDANCYIVKKKLKKLINYYDKLQLYKILDRCEKLSEPQVHLIAERLHQIQIDETTALQELYFGYKKFLNYMPLLTFIAFIILTYEIVRRFVLRFFISRNAI